MRLFIAEKPSLARAIADALPGPRTRRRGFIECGREDVVAWCAGHVLELVEPEQYALEYKAWRIEHLPIAPTTWRLAVTAPELVDTIRSLLPRASRVVHAGDPDREGQLLVDEVLEFLGYKGPVDRLLISDLNLPAVRKALGEVQSNAKYRGLYEAALARQRADWLFGINLTRLYTVLGRSGGYDGVLSVGRVQTPLLGLIVRRDIVIEGFKSRTYYVVRAAMRSVKGTFKCAWQPPDDGAGILDEAGRLLSRDHALALQRKIAGRIGEITRCESEKKAEPPPLPYSLPDLQVDAGKRLGLGPKETLDACQALYETHRLLTYPRSDCRYLPEGHLDQTMGVLAAVVTNVPALAPQAGKADRKLRSRAWNDAKVSAHHAIIPTLVAKPGAELPSAERGVYELVARRYLAQFFPSFEFHETRIELSIEGECFRVSGRQPVAEGWRVLFAPVAPDDDADESKASHQEEFAQSLPVLEKGEQIECREVDVNERQTTSPKRFTEASLIQAMTGIARYVEDPQIKQLLRETDGIGTPATQASIIQTLLDRRFVERRRGRQIAATEVGRALVQILPDVATRPDMTALWEAAMRRIAEGKMPLVGFLDGVVVQLRQLVGSGRALGALKVPGVRPCPAPGCIGALRRRGGKSGPFWGCTRYPECRYAESEAPASGRGSRPRRTSPRLNGSRRGPLARKDTMDSSAPIRAPKPTR